MQYLSTLTPGEILLLTKETVTQKEILKITFVDLLFKKVLKTYEVDRRPSARDEIRTYQYVAIGENFDKYVSLNHERIFLSTFAHDKSAEILFRNLVKIGFQKSKTLSDLKNDIIKTPNLKSCFVQNIFQRIFYGYSFTEYGIELKKKLQTEIQHNGNELSDIENVANHKIVELIKIIGGNIFLIINIDHDLLAQIDKELGIEINKNSTYSGDNGCSGCASTWEHYSSDFDSGCSGDNGCGGDSGCSGCGGCGGD